MTIKTENTDALIQAFEAYEAACAPLSVPVFSTGYGRPWREWNGLDAAPQAEPTTHRTSIISKHGFSGKRRQGAPS